MYWSCLLLCGLCAVCHAETDAPTCDPRSRMVAVGDLHGDLENALETLQRLNVVDQEGNWSGGRTVLVQTGDLLDRGPDSVGLVTLFRGLQREAREAGGDVVLLLGNHELMNRQHYWDDVSREEILRLGLKSLKEKERSLRAMREGWKVWEEMMENGMLAQHIMDLPAIAIVGTGKCRTVFSHAGLLSQHIAGDFSVDKYNNYSRDILAREKAADREADGFSDEHSPLWNRILSWGPEEVACDHVDQVLRQLNASQMVVGHSVHKRITTRCGGRLQLIDIGISRVYGGRIGGWQCENDVVKALYPGAEYVLHVDS